MRGDAARGTGATPWACFGGGGLTNEKAYLLGKFARVVLRTRNDRLQRPLLHVVGGGRAATGRSASTAGCRSRWRTSPQADVMLLVGANPAETMPPVDAVLRRGPRARRARTIVVDPRATATAARRTPAPAAAPRAPICALANGLLHLVVREGCVDERLHRRRGRPGSTPSGAAVAAYWPDRVERITGVAGGRSADDRARCSATAPIGDDPDRARARSSTATARTPCRPSSTWRWRWACRAGRSPATARSPARATGRAGGSTARRPTSCPATASSTTRRSGRTSPRVWGVDPDELPGPGRVGVRDARRGWAPTAACGRCWCWPPTSRSRRPTSNRVERRLRALDLLVVCDMFLSETAALADVVLPDRAVGRGGGHDDQPRGPGAAPPPGARRRRDGRARPTWRC